MKQLDDQFNAKVGGQLYYQLDSQLSWPLSNDLRRRLSWSLSSDLGMLRQYLKHQFFETLEEELL